MQAVSHEGYSQDPKPQNPGTFFGVFMLGFMIYGANVNDARSSEVWGLGSRAYLRLIDPNSCTLNSSPKAFTLKAK